MGFEPTTSSMPSRRAPNCATAPPKECLSLSQPVKESLASSLQAFPNFIIIIDRCRLCCRLFEETNEPAHPTPKACQKNSGSSYCGIGFHVCGRLLVVSPAAYPSETSRSFRILHRPAHSVHSGKGRKDQLRNRPAKPGADRHLCPLRVSARRLRALLVRQAALRPAYSHVIRTSLTLRRYASSPPLAARAEGWPATTWSVLCGLFRRNFCEARRRFFQIGFHVWVHVANRPADSAAQQI
jgi:hypothetical protein